MVKAKRWCWREIDELVRHLVRLMPVLRLRDARFMRQHP
ncbi:OLD family ATP-dependent endonuclease [Klebsiella pneumoniae subsp. rhinoscleromatis]|nr:OLD family ATP-dependent endonuclease [Klebsiella pneumoniae subsp. rhinoscleromatis]